MRYVLKQHFFAWANTFDVCDSNEEKRFTIEGQVFSLGHKLSFLDTAGQELAFIKQKLLAWGPTYEIYRHGELCAVIKKELFTLLNCRFSIDVPGPNDIEAQGDFLQHEYAFVRGDSTIATASKKWFAWTDTYGVDIQSGEDDVLILACAVVIDLVCHDRRSRD